MAGDLGRLPLVLVGFMASGKTSIGRVLAGRLGRSFVDTDREIERLFGLTIPAIFARHGEQEFRDAERRLIDRLLDRRGEVLSIGGGAFVDEATRASIKARGLSIWLDPPFDLIIERIARSGMRPLASGKPESELRQLWEERRSLYSEADIRAPARDNDPEQVAEWIVAELDVRRAGPQG